MIFDPNLLFSKMAYHIAKYKDSDNKILICNEGGSRSSKTFDTFHLLVFYCDHNRDKKKDIYIFRDTLTNCKDYTYKDFLRCMSIIGCEFQSNNPQKPNINLFGNNIYFRGLSDEQNAEAAPSDIIFVNETLDIDSYSMVSGWIMRCREFCVFDWNPKFTEHWIYDFDKRPNCLFTHSTYKDNKHLEKSVVSEIESYNPEIQSNIDNKTANKYRWQVYGLGLRASPEGLIFQDITWIDELPESFELEGFGLDYGFTNHPSALTQVRKEGKNLYAKLHLYFPVDNADLLYNLITPIVLKNTIIADSADTAPSGKRMTTDLRMKGLNVIPVYKPAGSIQYGIDLMKRYNLHIVRNPDARKEAENYKYETIRGINTGIPIDKYNHFWDSFRYVVMTLFRFN